MINKSRFIGLLIPLKEENQVKEILKDLKKEFPKATHYCYAYRLEDKEKSSDDGEPSGTAGRPMLEFLIKNNLSSVLAVVVRYFGGIKLGAGGLLRAYVDTLRNTYALAEIYEEKIHNVYEIEIKYSLYDIISSYLSRLDGIIINTEFNESVKITYSNTSLDEDKLNELTSGQIKINNIGQEKVYVKVRSV